MISGKRYKNLVKDGCGYGLDLACVAGGIRGHERMGISRAREYRLLRRLDWTRALISALDWRSHRVRTGRQFVDADQK